MMNSINKSLNTDEVLRAISSYLELGWSRRDLVEWAENRKEEHKVISYLYKKSDNPYIEDAFNTTASATVTDKTFKEEGPPYFIRDYDFQEWLFTLTNEDYQPRDGSDIVQLRPHQVSRIGARQYIAINIDAPKIAREFEIEHIRGLDYFDFYQEFNFELNKRVQFRLLRYLRSPEPDAFIFYSNFNDPVIEIADLLKRLGISISDVLWINPEIKRKLWSEM